MVIMNSKIIINIHYSVQFCCLTITNNKKMAAREKQFQPPIQKRPFSPPDLRPAHIVVGTTLRPYPTAVGECFLLKMHVLFNFQRCFMYFKISNFILWSIRIAPQQVIVKETSPPHAKCGRDRDS